MYLKWGENKMKTKITVKQHTDEFNKVKEFSIKFNPDLNIYEMMDSVVKPLLASMGYHPKSIAVALGEEEDE